LVLIPVFPIVAQLKSQVNNGAFKLIQIKHLSFLFRAPNGTSVTIEGIALPIFISQLIGYILFCLLGILDLLLYFMSPTLFTIMTFVIGLILFAEMISLAVFDMVLLKLSRSKQYFKRNKCKKTKK
jgi:hypothetical protein